MGQSFWGGLSAPGRKREEEGWACSLDSSAPTTREENLRRRSANSSKRRGLETRRAHLYKRGKKKEFSQEDRL